MGKVLADLVELSGYLHLDGFYGLFGGDYVFDFHEDVLDLHVGLFVHVLGWVACLAGFICFQIIVICYYLLAGLICYYQIIGLINQKFLFINTKFRNMA